MTTPSTTVSPHGISSGSRYQPSVVQRLTGEPTPPHETQLLPVVGRVVAQDQERERSR